MFFSSYDDFMRLKCFIFKRLTLFNPASFLCSPSCLLLWEIKKAVTQKGHGCEIVIYNCEVVIYNKEWRLTS